MAIPTKEEWTASLASHHGHKLQQAAENATVAVCGLGGLGSNIAASLVRFGIGRLILIDFDRVELSNLNRQQYKISQIGMYKADALCDNLREISPYIVLEPHTCRITAENLPSLLGSADIICEAFDKAEEKAMLVNGVLENLPSAYLVAGSGMAGISSANQIRTRKVTSHFILCGDEQSGVEDDSTLIGARVALCAAHEALAVVQLLAENDC